MIRRFVTSAAERGWNALIERRLPLSPSLWLRHLKNHWRELRAAPPDDSLARIKAALARDRRAELLAFLDSTERLALPVSEPRLSILIVAWNRAELLLGCLRALVADTPFEVIIVDNGSHDETSALLDRVGGATIIRNSRNLGYPAAVNQAAKAARGELLCLLNHDAEPLPGAIDAAVSALAEDVGAVGGRLILPDGTLQEAGSAVFADGSCVGIGRGQSPDAPAFMYRRDVDFSSAAFLVTPRALFQRLGGFDEGYGPAYYEDVDYCVRLWKSGRRVVYEPDAAAAHFEFASTTSSEAARMQYQRRARFVAAHDGWRRPDAQGLRILVVDDRVPHPHLGSGFPRAQSLVRALVAAGHEVTLFPLLWPHDQWRRVRRTLPPTVEVMLGSGVSGLRRFLDERRGHYHRTIVSRPNNLRTLRSLAPDWPDVIYDAEALFALRDGGDLEAELSLARGVRAILTVSSEERRHFEKLAPCFTVGHALSTAPTPRSFHQRRGLLFVGGFHHDHSPNSEAMTWFTREVRLDLPLTVIGHQPPPLDHADVRGTVEDLTPFYDRARIFVAPLRSGAGLPYKAHHAAAHGVPLVATSLVARQLGWRDELVIADSAAEFADKIRALHEDEATWTRLREAALARVAEECAPELFEKNLLEALR